MTHQDFIYAKSVISLLDLLTEVQNMIKEHDANQQPIPDFLQSLFIFLEKSENTHSEVLCECMMDRIAEFIESEISHAKKDFENI